MFTERGQLQRALSRRDCRIFLLTNSSTENPTLFRGDFFGLFDIVLYPDDGLMLIKVLELDEMVYGTGELCDGWEEVNH